jgi:ABC-type nitrate/sulfonate/bicarbonate transport system ATPase subunit
VQAVTATFEAKQFAITGHSPGLTWSTEAAHTVMVGATRAFIDACAGLDGAYQGELRLFGQPPARALRDGLATYLPCHWTKRSPRTPRLLVQAATGLASQSTGVEEALKHFELAVHASKKVSTLTPAQQRATEFACAYAAQTNGLVFDDPFGMVNDPRAFATLEAHFRSAFDARSWVAFVPHLENREHWLAGAQVLRLHNGVPDTRTYRTRTIVQTVESNDGLRERLIAHGMRPSEGAHSRIFYLEGPCDTATIFQSAEESGTRIVRLEPIEVE